MFKFYSLGNRVVANDNYTMVRALLLIKKNHPRRILGCWYWQFLKVMFGPMMRNPKLCRTDADIKVAARAWTNPATRAAAEITYGHISDWETDLVTNMDKLFCVDPENGGDANMESFIDDISRWDVSNVTILTGKFGIKAKIKAHSINQTALPLLAKLICSNNTEAVKDACQGISYFSDGPNYFIDTVLQSGVAPRLVELLSHQSESIQTFALRAVGNIVSGTDHQTQAIIDLNAIPALVQILGHQKKVIVKEACWTLSNINAGTVEQITHVINAGAIPKFNQLLKRQDFDIQKEAAWAIINITSGGNNQQVIQLVDEGSVESLVILLNEQKASFTASVVLLEHINLTIVILEGLKNFLENVSIRNMNPNKISSVQKKIRKCGGVAIFEDLRRIAKTKSSKVYWLIEGIMNTYFNT